MRAIQIERYGAPELMTERDISPPDPNPGEVLIQVAAAGVNFADLLQRLRLYANAPKLPYVPGFEVSGRVDGLGRGVDCLKEGDRVAALTRFGGYAEIVCAPESQVVKLPDEVSLTDAAAIPVNFLTAWFCLYVMGTARPGDRVLIQNGAGGVGTAAVQLAVDRQCTVFATAGSDEKVEFLRKLGAQHPINYRREDFSRVVRDAGGGRGADVVLDGIGGKTLAQGYELLAPLGRLVSYGLSAAAPSEKRRLLSALLAWWKTPRFDPLSLIGRNVGIFGFHLAYLEERRAEVESAFEAILAMTAEGRLKPVIDRVFPLTRGGAIDAHRRLHRRANIGKVLLSTEGKAD